MRQFIKSAFVLVVALFVCCEARAEMATHIALHGEEVSYLGGEVSFPEIVLMDLGIARTGSGTTIKSQNHSIVFTTDDKWDDDYGPKLSGICMPNWVESFDISVDYRSESVKGSCKFSDFDPVTLVNVDGHLSKAFSSSLAGGGGFTRTYVDPVTTKGHMKIKRNFGSQRRAFKLWCVDAVYGDIIGSDYQSPEAYYNTFCRAFVVTQPGQGFKLDYEGNAASKKVVGMHTGEGDDIDDFGVLTIPGYVVSSIADRAFVNCEFPATKVVLPGGNFTVGVSAFSGCSSLQSIEIVDSGKMCFDIGDYAFDGCTGLTSVHFPACVNKVGKGAFAHCSNLREFTVDDANSMSLSVRNGCLCDKLGLTLLACPATFTSVTIPSSITSIQYGAFMGCDNLTNVTTDPDREDWVAEQMLASGFNLDRVSLNGRRYGTKKGTVTFDLGEYGTRTGGGELVQEVVDGEAAVAPTVQALEGYEFYGWDAEFGNVTGPMTVYARHAKEGLLPDGDGYTEDVNGYLWAFSIVDGEAVIEPGISPEPIGELVIPSELGGCLVTTVAESAFDNDFADMSGLTSVTIPAGVIAIGDYAFWGCSALQTVIYEGDEDEIDFGHSVFEDTPYERNQPFSLIMDGTIVTGFKGAIPQSLVIPDGVAEIWEYAFSYCSGLRSVVIPESVVYIGDSAFAGCEDLLAMCFTGNSPEIGETIFGSKGEWLPGTGFEWESPSTIDENLTTYVREGTSGWGEVPGEWCGRPIEWWTTYPDVPVDETVEDGVYVVSKDGYDWTVTVEYGEVWIGDRTAWSYSEAAISPQPSGALEIPDEFFGLPVVGLSTCAFMYCTEMTSVRFPKDMWSVSSWAFMGCSALTSISVDDENESLKSEGGFLLGVDWDGRTSLELAVGKTGACAVPDGVATVYPRAFSLCPEMTELALPESVVDFDVSAVDDCATLVSITLAEDNPNFRSANGLLLSKDGTSLVACPGGIADVVVPDGIQVVGSFYEPTQELFSPFPSSAKMRSITIPASVRQISDGAFSACESLTEITVDPGNAVYAAANGLLMTADGRTLLACAGGCIDVVIPDGVTEIGGSAFVNNSLMGNYSLRSVTVPSSVCHIEAGAFSCCYYLTSVCFAGAAPEVDDSDGWTYDLYEGSEYVTTYVQLGAQGWGVVPGTWHERPIKWWTMDNPSPIPELEDDADVNQVYMALYGSTDDKLVDNILMTCLTEGDVAGADLYNNYRLWAGRARDEKGDPLGLQAVRNSPTAWTSFALDQTTLLERNLTDEDLKIEEFKPSMDAGTFDFTVSIKDVEVGPLAMAENLKKTFGLEGATELVPSAFGEANVDIEFGMPEDGKLKFTAEPLDKDAKSFFMKMKIR